MPGHLYGRAAFLAGFFMMPIDLEPQPFADLGKRLCNFLISGKFTNEAPCVSWKKKKRDRQEIYVHSAIS